MTASSPIRKTSHAGPEPKTRERNIAFMPWAPPHPCSWPSCPGLAELDQRFCIEHRRTTYRKVDDRRVTPAERAFSAIWQEFSTTYLSRPENAACVDCGEAANYVYHSTRAKFQQPVKILEENCAAVCSTCCKVRERHRR